MKQPFLFIALDGLHSREKETLKIAEQLSAVPGPFGFKVNLDYLLNLGVSVRTSLRWIRRLGRPVFADIKMWNGPGTMESVIGILVEAGVEYTNVYALADNLLPPALKVAEGTKTKVLGLTVLSHYSEGYCQKHFYRSLAETVRHFAIVALEAGCHGIILPGTALDIVQDLKTIKAVPGIRPIWYKDTRHEEEIQPGEAVKKDANILVCGSPIMKTPDKVAALKKVLFEMTRQPIFI